MKKKIINIFGSTGEIGSKSISILLKNFNFYKINLLVANKNYKKLIYQAKLLKPKYICLLDKSKNSLLKKSLKNIKVEIIEPDKLYNYIYKSSSDITLISISGYNALNYLLPIFKNTNLIGMVNKECIVSAGHLFNKLCKKYKTQIFPIDSEHFSLFQYINISKFKNIKTKNIYLTASGGPFYKDKKNQISNKSVKEALNHPKWKMGYKNSIDSATLVNKCLEIIEAHYLFNLPFEKLKIVIHPEALIHSIIEYKNYTSIMNYFYHDMSIPLYNFFSYANKVYKYNLNNETFAFKMKETLNFDNPDDKKFPILKIFNKLDKSNPLEVIKFNCSNEFAVDLFVKKRIKFSEINKIIEKSLSIDLKSRFNTISSILDFQQKYLKKLQYKFKKYNI